MAMEILESEIENQNIEKTMSFVQNQIEVSQRMQYISFAAPIIIILLITFLVKCKHKDQEVGIKGYGIASSFTTISIITTILLIIFIWFGKYKMTTSTQIILLTTPFIIVFLSNSKGFFNAIKLIIMAFIPGLGLFLIAKILDIFLKAETIYIIEKIIITLLSILVIDVIKDFAFKGWYRGKIPITRHKKTYNSYFGSYSNNYTPSYPSNNSSSSIFDSDVKVQYNMFSGKNEYYQNGKLIATGEKGILSNDEYIKDTNGNTILTKKEGFLNDYIYEDSHGNTVYKENHDYFTGGSNVTDNNYNNVASHDPWDDIFNTGKNYTSKK